MGLSVQGLRVFLGILEYGSLSAAGRGLGMTQPAVSNHLRILEQRFGVTLLTRGRCLKATPAGECLAGHARRMLEEIEVLDEEMSRHSAPCGRLLVGASSTPGEFLLPRLAVRYAAEYPEVALDVHISDTAETVRALLDREFEVAVVGREVDEPRIEATVVEQDELVAVIAASGSPAVSEVGPAELVEHPFVMRERGSATREVVEDRLATAGFEPSIVMELGSNAAVAGAVAAGAGVGVLPGRSLAGQQKLRSFPVRGLAFRRPFVMLVERGRRLSPAAEAFTVLCLGKDV